jgi:hypothetical protein
VIELDNSSVAEATVCRFTDAFSAAAATTVDLLEVSSAVEDMASAED